MNGRGVHRALTDFDIIRVWWCQWDACQQILLYYIKIYKNFQLFTTKLRQKAQILTQIHDGATSDGYFIKRTTPTLSVIAPSVVAWIWGRSSAVGRRAVCPHATHSMYSSGSGVKICTCAVVSVAPHWVHLTPARNWRFGRVDWYLMVFFNKNRGRFYPHLCICAMVGCFSNISPIIKHITNGT